MENQSGTELPKTQTGDPKSHEPKESTPEPKFTQQDVDRVVQDRLAREKAKYSDYEETKQKLQELDKLKSQQEQMDMEKKQEYDKLKEQWGQTESQYKSMIEQKDAELKDVHIKNSLVNEVIKNNAYPETVELIRSQAVLEDGVVKIKGKDSNGIDTTLSVEEGVKQFLTQKQYLVKPSGSGGSGTPPANGGAGQIPNQDLFTEWQNAKNSGDVKKANELKMKLKAKHASMGGTSFV